MELNIGTMSLASTVMVIIVILAMLVYDNYRVFFKDSVSTARHRTDHILIYSIFSAGYVWFVYTFMFHEGLDHSITKHLICEKSGYGLLLMNVGILMLTRHLCVELREGKK